MQKCEKEKLLILTQRKINFLTVRFKFKKKKEIYKNVNLDIQYFSIYVLICC